MELFIGSHSHHHPLSKKKKAVCAETMRLGIHWKAQSSSQCHAHGTGVGAARASDGAVHSNDAFKMVSPLDVCCRTPLGRVLIELQEYEPALVEMVAKHYSKVVLGAVSEAQAALKWSGNPQESTIDNSMRQEKIAYVLGSKQATRIASQVFQCDYLQPYFIEAVHLTKNVPRLLASMSTETEEEEEDDAEGGQDAAAVAAAARVEEVWEERIIGLSEHLDLQASVSAAVSASPFVVQPHIAGGANTAKDFIDALSEATAGDAGCGEDEDEDDDDDEDEDASEDSNEDGCGRDAEFLNPRRLLQKVSMKLQPHLTDAGLAALVSAHPEITHLDLGECINLTAGGILDAIETGCTQNLEAFRIGSCRGSHDALESALVLLLQTTTALHHSNLQTAGGTGKGDAFLAAVAQKHPSMQTLNLDWDAGNGAGSDSSETMAAAWPSAGTAASFSPPTDARRRVTDVGLHAIAARCRGLREVSLRGCIAVTDVGVTALLTANPRVQKLDLGGCKMTNQTLVVIFATCSELAELCLTDCTRISRSGVCKIITMPSLMKIDLTGCFKSVIKGLLGSKGNTAWMLSGLSCTECIDRQIKQNAEQHPLLHHAPPPPPACMHMARIPRAKTDHPKVVEL